jgi:hypothetical protein
MDFRSEGEIDHFLSTFEAGTLPRYCWTHAAHVAMCAARLWRGDEDAAVAEGIRQYNRSQGIVDTPTSGYHETLTRFWIETVRGTLREAGAVSRLEAVRGAVRVLGRDSFLPRRRYSFDVFASVEARARWIEPDLFEILSDTEELL